MSDGVEAMARPGWTFRLSNSRGRGTVGVDSRTVFQKTTFDSARTKIGVLLLQLCARLIRLARSIHLSEVHVE
jgi:hypothetical protein